MVDLTAMLINLGNSLGSVQKLVSGLGYLLGIVFIFSGLMELKKHAETRGSHDDALSAISYILGGSMLVYMTSSVTALSNTVFGASNVLSYATATQPNFYHAMLVIIQTTGVIWFVRGMVLVVQSTKPGQKEGAKGMTFLFAGVCAINFESCIRAVATFQQQFFQAMTFIKTNGYLIHF